MTRAVRRTTSAAHRRLFNANNTGGGSATAFIRVKPGATTALGAATFTRADSTTCAKYVDVNGVVQTVAAAVLRDSHYVGSTRTILLEPTRTNLSLRATDLSAGSWTLSSVTITNAATTGPDNVAGSAQKVVEAAATAFHSATDSQVTASGAETHQFYVKPSGRTKVALREGATSGAYASFLLTGAGSVLDSGTGASGAAITALTGTSAGWYLLTFKATVTNPGFSFYLLPDSYTTGGVGSFGPYAGDGSSGAFVWLADLSVGAFPCMPIVTAAATVTRAVDALSLAGTSALGSGAQTLFYHYYDLSTSAWTDAVAAYTAGDPIVPTTGKAYSDIAVLRGTLTAAQCKAALGGTFP